MTGMPHDSETCTTESVNGQRKLLHFTTRFFSIRLSQTQTLAPPPRRNVRLADLPDIRG